MAQPFKHPKTGIYQLRRKVPAALRGVLNCTEYKRSLGTRDPHEAKRRFAGAWLECEHAFALARAQQDGAEVLSAADAQQLAARWFRQEQARLAQTGAFTDMLAEVGSVSFATRQGEEEAPTFTTLREGLPESDGLDWHRDVVNPVIERSLRQHGLPLPLKGSSASARLFAAFDQHIELLSQWALKRHEGGHEPLGLGIAVIEPLQAENLRASREKGKGQSLPDLFAKYSENKVLNDGDTRATRRTLKAYRSVVEGFIELHGDLRVHEITRAVIAEHRASLAKLPAKGDGIRGLAAPQLIEKAEREKLPLLSSPTIRNRLRAVSAVLSYGVQLGWLQENPVIASGAGRAAAKAATRKSAAAGRKHYTRDELQLVFSSPVFSAGSHWSTPRADFGRAWYWVPLMLYYTGARREEVAQLRVADVMHADDCGWYLSILANDDDDAARGVKTESSRRLIPLHTDLIQRGLLDYVREQPSNGQLFPSLKPDPKGYYGANFGKRWAAYLRGTVKLASPASPSHGFRHTFKTLCREVGIPEEVHNAITGHSGGGVGRDYGEMPLLRMAIEMRKFPAVPVQS